MVQENSDLNVLKGKKLLVLGGAFQHCKVVEAAHELGIIVYVTDYLDNSPAKKLADVALDIDVKDVDSIVKYCKKNNIEGVINTSLDPCQIPYQEICERLNLPCYGTRKQFEILTNKKIFKEYCKKYGVDTIQEFTEEDIKNNNIEFPVLIKPEISRGSRGQSVCYNKKDLLQALKYVKKQSVDGKVIIEKYIENCQDFVVSYIFINGKQYIVRTGDRYLGEKEEGLDRTAIAVICPSKYTQIYLKHAEKNLINMLKNIGIKDGPVFFQGFVSKNKVHFYDPGFRFAGGEYERSFNKLTGINLIKYLIKFSLCGKFDDINISTKDYLLNNKKIVQLCPALKPGKISLIEGEKVIKSNESINSFFKRYNENDIVPDTDDVRRRFAEICFICDTDTQFNLITEFIKNNLSVKNDKGEDMICSKFNPLDNY